MSNGDHLASLVFVSIRGNSRGFANFRKMFLKFVKTHIFNIFGSSRKHSYQWRRICSDSKAFVKIR